MSAAPGFATSPPFSAILRAQAQIWVRSPLIIVPFGAIGYSLVVAGLRSVTARPTWAVTLAHLNMWVVMIGPVFTALLAGALAMIDRRSCGGGIGYRAVTPTALRNARFAIVACWCLLAHGATVLVTGAVGLVSTTTPATQIVTDSAELLLVLWVSYLGYCALLTLIDELAGIAGCVGTGLLFSALGTVTAESSQWYLAPPAWIIRPALPLIGTHANGVGLDGERIAHGPTAVALGAAFAVAVLVVAPAVSAVLHHVRQSASSAPAIGTGVHRARQWSRRAAQTDALHPPVPARQRLRPVASERCYGSAASAILLILRSWWVGSLAVSAIALTVLVQWWYDPSAAYLFFALMVLPSGCAVLPAIWIPRLSEGYRAVAARPRGPRAMATLLTASLLATEALVCVTVGAAAVLAGQPITAALLRISVSTLIGAMLVLTCALITAAAGRITGLLVGFVGQLFGTLVGGTGLAASVGLAVPWSWAASLEPNRLVITIPLALTAATLSAICLHRILIHTMTRT